MGKVEVYCDEIVADSILSFACGDSFLDGVDKNPVGDALVKLTIAGFWLDDYTDGTGFPVNVFFSMKANGFHYATARFNAVRHLWSYPSLVYYFDVWDSNDTVQFEFRAWDDDGVSGSTELDICNGPSKGITFNFAVRSDRWEEIWGTTTYSGNGTSDSYDQQYDANVTITVENVVREKARTIVVNATDYGLYEVEDGLRYTADDQLFVFYLNCSSSSTHFVQGVNVVLLPRSIALESKINDTLWNIETITSGSPLYGANFHRTNVSASLASGHIIAVISKNMTAAMAEDLLAMMTHNATNARIGNNVTVESTEILYLMHLPRDVLASVPLLQVANSPTGNVPTDFWGWLTSTIVSIADFLWRGFLATASFMIKLAVALVEICVKFIDALVQATAAIIEAAVDAIVDAFMAFVRWAIEIIKSVVDALLSPTIQGIGNLVGSYYRGLAASVKGAATDYAKDGKIDSSTYSRLSSAWFGSLYWILLGIGAVLTVILLILTPITAPFSFLLSFVATAIIGFIAFGAFGVTESEINAAASQYKEYAECLPDDPDTEPYLQYAGVLINEGVNETEADEVGAQIFAGKVIIQLFGISAGMAVSAASILLGFAKGIISLALSIAAFLTKNLSLTVISLPVSLLMLVHTLAYSELGAYGIVSATCSGLAFAISLYTLNTRH